MNDFLRINRRGFMKLGAAVGAAVGTGLAVGGYLAYRTYREYYRKVCFAFNVFFNK